MAVAMIALAGIVGLEIPAINSIPAPAASAMLTLLRERAAAESDLIDVYGYPAVREDRAGDVTGAPAAEVDLLRGEVAYVPFVEDWLVDAFDCDLATVVCGDADHQWKALDDAYLFVGRAAATIPVDDAHQVAILVALEDEVTAFTGGPTEPFGGASRVFLARGGAEPSLEARRSQGDGFSGWTTAARAMWSGTDLMVLVPASELSEPLLAWDVVLMANDGSRTSSSDTLRATWDSPLNAWEPSSRIFVDDYRDAD